ncbi:type II toxin-antitoxin system CcdA family antitoxin [Candidatus Bathyarchaeota archaeon]|nr:type II toxin-antitoxin system CcdA family antitoxin [Candidatus Bathyarchaeota archaeon]
MHVGSCEGQNYNLIEDSILKKAKEIGLNISQVVENALKLYINSLENANKQIANNQTYSA